tara:strand:+ start:2240 stop:2509 length:270 start_codon:yes stop_codon:yes gene_type:complete
VTQCELLIPTLPATSIRKRRNLMVFGSKEAAYAWADGHVPRKVAGAIGFNPPHAVSDKEAGGWVLRYSVQMGGHVRYLVLSKGGQLVKV